MPIPAAALIGGAASLIGTGINAASTGNQNRKNREFSEKMYDRQKDDSLEFWQMQNNYNSPEAQMARLQKAGLNPNLVYGNGSAVNTAGSIDTPHAQPYRGEAPQLDLPQAVEGYFNAQTQQQLLSNQKKQGDLLAMEALVKDAQIKNTNANTLQTIENTTQSQGSYGLRQAKLQHDVTNAFNNIARGLATTEAIQLDNKSRPIQLEGQKITNQGNALQNQLREIELGMRKNGLNPNDPSWMRILFQQLGDKLPWLLK